VFLIGLPAGALADIIDRRRLLLWTQSWMLAAAAALGVLTLAGATTPWVLLALTFALGLGAAMNAPAWQAIVPELAPPAELPAAIALNGVGFNIARAIGPALGGLIVAAAGTAAVFLLNAASFLGVLVVLYRWRRPPRTHLGPPERVFGAMQAGLRYVRYAPALSAVLIRAGIFILCGAALWSLLPLVARQELGLEAVGYGVLFGCLGLGAVMGAALLPQLRQRVAIDALVAGAIILFAAATFALASVQHFALLCAAMVAGGAAWMTVMSTFSVAVQTAVPGWVRARALAVYMLVFQGGLAAGSALWGAIATHRNIPLALQCAAVGLVVGLLAMFRYRLQTGDGLDLTPSMHWSEPIVVNQPDPEDGPVLVTVEYHIAPEHARDFAQAMRAMRRIRRRDGAIRWGLFTDAADPGRYLETFVVDSWAEHLRQHERMTVADRAIENRLRVFHQGDSPPAVSHFISAYAGKETLQDKEV
jgi:MFS family permease